MSRVTLEPKYAAEVRKATFDFTSQLAVGETLSTISVTASVYSGTDAAASGVIGSSAISGLKVIVGLTNGVAGVTYLITCSCTTSASQTLILSAYLTVVPATT